MKKSICLIFVMIVFFSNLISAQIAGRQVCTHVVVMFVPGGGGSLGTLQNEDDGRTKIVLGIVDELKSLGYTPDELVDLGRQANLPTTFFETKTQFPKLSLKAKEVIDSNIESYRTKDECVLFVGYSAGAGLSLVTMKSLVPESFPELFSISFGAPKEFSDVLLDYRMFKYNHVKDGVAISPLEVSLLNFLTGKGWTGHDYQWGGRAGSECDINNNHLLSSEEINSNEDIDCADFEEFKKNSIEFIQKNFNKLGQLEIVTTPTVSEITLTP